MIQISEVAPDKAALKIADLCDERGGQWIVNAVEDEGFVAARVGYPFAQRLERNGSPNLAGPFNSRWLVCNIAADLAAAQVAGRSLRVVTSRDRTRKPKTRLELMDLIAALLSDHAHRVTDMERATGASAFSIRAALRRMKESGDVVSHRSRTSDTLYMLAARERRVA